MELNIELPDSWIATADGMLLNIKCIQGLTKKGSKYYVFLDSNFIPITEASFNKVLSYYKEADEETQKTRRKKKIL